MRIRAVAAAVAAVLALAGCVGSGTEETAPEATGPWTYTTGFGEKIELEKAPEVIVVDAYSAAALWEYGVRPDGVFGYGLEEGASPVALGDADRTQLNVIGTGADLEIEKLAALQPDLIIGFGNAAAKGAQWTWWEDDLASQVKAIAPFAGIRFSQRPVVEVIEEYRSLAKALGADTDGESVTGAKRSFDAAKAALQETVSGKEGLKTIALNGDASVVYAGTSSLAQLALLEEVGVDLVGPKGDDGGAWAEISWEVVPDHPADIVLQYIASAEAFAGAPVYRAMPAVRAGQIAVWDDKMPFTYSKYAAWLTEVEGVYADAKSVTG